MECPLCSSRRIFRDYAPARSYALILAGLLVVFARRFISPEFFAWGAGEVDRMLVFGVVVAAYGIYDTMRHGNRYCGRCGYRFRYTRGASRFDEVVEGGASAPLGGRDSDASDRSYKIDPNTPVEPVLKCLRFKDEKQRRTAADTLRRLTGEDFGEDAEAWEKWWAENKEEYKKNKRAKKQV